jgi:hypothetical protein
MVAQVRYSVTEQSGGRVTLCAVYTVHMEMRSTCFLVEPQNQGLQFVSGLALKPVVTVFSGLASKPVATVLSDLASKPVVTVSWLSFKIKVVEGFPVWTLKPTATV